MLKRLVLLLWLCCLTGFAVADNDDLDELRSNRNISDWYLVKEDSLKNIKTWAKQEDGKRIRSFKGDVIIDAPFDAVARVHFDVENMRRWYYETEDSALIKKISPTELYYYMRYRAPATLPDRDSVLHMVIEPYSFRKGYLLLRIEAVPLFIPEKNGLIRIRSQDMMVKISPMADNRTHLEFEGYLDPGGSSPIWAVNFVQRRAPYTTMLGLQRVAKLPQYQDPNIAAGFHYKE